MQILCYSYLLLCGHFLGKLGKKTVLCIVVEIKLKLDLQDHFTDKVFPVLLYRM